MSKILKLVIGIGACGFYYLVFCMIFGIDAGDPWNRMMEWAYSDMDNKK